jgi:WYL_2, Sm-like SH3 beta-barrel fold
MNLNERELKLFKKWLTGCLASGPIIVTFTKKDGSERVMECTTSTSLVPQEPITESLTPKREKKVNEDVCPVYDIESKHWKSFRWDSVKSVRLEIK